MSSTNDNDKQHRQGERRPFILVYNSYGRYDVTIHFYVLSGYGTIALAYAIHILATVCGDTTTRLFPPGF